MSPAGVSIGSVNGLRWVLNYGPVVEWSNCLPVVGDPCIKLIIKKN